MCEVWKKESLWLVGVIVLFSGTLLTVAIGEINVAFIIAVTLLCFLWWNLSWKLGRIQRFPDDLAERLRGEAREIRLIGKDIRNNTILTLKRDERERARNEKRYQRVRKALDDTGGKSQQRSAEIAEEISSSIDHLAEKLSDPWPLTPGEAKIWKLRNRFLGLLSRGRSSQAGEAEVEPSTPPTPDTKTSNRFNQPDISSEIFGKAKDRVRRATSEGDTSRKPRIIMVSSNGAGLGHLTRISAIERFLDSDVLIYTMSSAYHRLGKKSSEIIYFPSHGDLGMDGKVWNQLNAAHFTSIVEGFQPDAVVFDGTYVYRGVLDTVREARLPLVWVQRGCWKPEVDRNSKQRHNADQFAESVVIPGDYGCEETVDVGKDLEPVYVNPIVSVSPNEAYTRQEARQLLGLPPEKKLFLIQLGAGVINDITDLQTTAVRAVQELSEDWEPVLVRNPLASHDNLAEVLSIQAYPLSPYYAAFDAAAFAAGYNTAQESIAHGLPGIFIPNLATKTDDQQRRAENMEQKGLCLTAINREELVQAIQKLADEGVRESIKDNCRAMQSADGARGAAEEILRVVASSKARSGQLVEG